LIVRCLFYPY